MCMLKTFFNLFVVFWEFLFEFGPSVAVARIIRDLPFGAWEKRRVFYENRILGYIRKRYSASHEDEWLTSSHPANKTIWVMWWQGEDKMPPIVQACWSQLNAVATHIPVFLITKKNWRQYVEIPDYIVAKVDAGAISLTHFSDIIRVCLLEKYGGLWLDATIWCDHLSDDMFEKPFFTLHAPGMFPDFISRGIWIPFVLGSNGTKYPLFHELREFFFAYWKEHDILIDYLFIDFVVKVINEEYLPLRNDIESLAVDTGYYYLNLNINRKYIGGEFDAHLAISPLQKLTYKGKFQCALKDGSLTNYGYLLSKAGVKNA